MNFDLERLFRERKRTYMNSYQAWENSLDNVYQYATKLLLHATANILNCRKDIKIPFYIAERKNKVLPLAQTQ